MVDLFKYLVYIETPGIAGGKGNLLAGFKNKKDAQIYIEEMNKKSRNNNYYIVEREG